MGSWHNGKAWRTLVVGAVMLLALAACGGGSSSGGGSSDGGGGSANDCVGDQGCSNAIFTTLDVALEMAGSGIATAQGNDSNTVDGTTLGCAPGAVHLSGAFDDTTSPSLIFYTFAFAFDHCHYVSGKETDVTVNGTVSMDGIFSDDFSQYSFTLAGNPFSAVGTVNNTPVNFSCTFSLEYTFNGSDVDFEGTLCGKDFL